MQHLYCELALRTVCRVMNANTHTSVSMSTFSLVLQLYFTLRNALRPPKQATQGNYLRNAFVSHLHTAASPQKVLKVAL